VLIACWLALAAFPFAAHWAASRQPVAPAAELDGPAPVAGGPRMRTLPALTPDSPIVEAVSQARAATDPRTTRAAIASALGTLFDRGERDALLRFMATAGDDVMYGFGGSGAGAVGGGYPFRFGAVDRVLDRALPPALDATRRAAANDLGALLMVAAARYPDAGRLVGADDLAFAVLHRARADGSCLPQLNLALLVAADPWAWQETRELVAAERACPDDPTALWLRGQVLSRGVAYGGDPDPSLTVFRRLQERFPGSPAGWSGEADTELRLAYSAAADQPFTARVRFRRALALYRRAEGLGGDAGLPAGTARALAGLGRHGEAAAAQARALARAPGAARLQARHVEYLERDGDFGRAAEAAERFAAAPRFPDAWAQFPGADAGEKRWAFDEDALDPLSLGADRLMAVYFAVAPRVPATDGPGAAVNDLAFVPEFRPVAGVTGHDRWCPAWSHRRDLILAGRAGEALAGMPARFRDVRPHRSAEDCEGAPDASVLLLTALAQLEAGDLDGAIARMRTRTRTPFETLQQARQDLWRFSGKLDRAQNATEEWMRARPDDVTAATRAGEVAFLAEDYDRAAGLFERAVRHAWSSSGEITPAEAEARLKLGTALELAGRLPEARAELAASDEVASRLLGRDDLGSGARGQAWFTSYYARLQGGDAELRARRYGAAAELYAAALERRDDPLEEIRATADRRPEVLENNRALVQAQLGLGTSAIDAARRAVEADPANPLFRLTEAFAWQRLGRADAAIASYRRAVAAEPQLPEAWNDLGVTLAEAGRRAEAVEAFRRAVGVKPDYAFAWFNLGVGLEHGAPHDALAAQGAFARAIRADADLRTRRHDYVAADGPYITTLDLSKPLPPRWDLAEAEHRTPVIAVGLALALLLGLRAGRSLASSGLGADAHRWLELVRDLLAKAPQPLRFTSAAAAVVVTLAVFSWSLLRSEGATVTTVMLQLAGLGTLIAIVMRARVLAARRAGVELRQRGWTPGMAVGAGAAAFGLAWAPLPVAQPSKSSSTVHWIGPVLAGCTALVLLVLGALTDVPLTTSLGAGGLVMAASMLVPIEPLDGGFIGKSTAGVTANLALLGGALFVLLGLS
jgi:tetratricopeptide (TPR) repeat protein